MRRPLKYLFQPGFLAGLALASVAILHVRAAAPGSGSERLRRLIVLPTISFSHGYTARAGAGFSVISDRAAKSERLPALRQAARDSPSDGRILFQLAKALWECDQDEEANRLLPEAVGLLRRMSADHPYDGALLTELGRALDACGKEEEAESHFRRATTSSPGDWRCWIGLGQFLGNKSLTLLAPKSAAQGTGNPSAVASATLRDPPSPEEMTRARELDSEAARCFDCAVDIAGAEAEVFAERGINRMRQAFLERLLRQIRGDDPRDPRGLARSMFTRTAIHDFERAAELNPTNTLVIGTVAFLAFLGDAGDTGTGGDLSNRNMANLPETARQSVRRAMTRLEDLGQGANPRAAARALEMLAFVKAFAASDYAGARESIGRALALDPAHEPAWEMAMGFAAQAKDPSAMLRLAEKRSAANPTSRNVFLLAKSLDLLGHTDKALEQMRRAVRISPQDPVANQGLFALLVKTAPDRNSLAGAMPYLEKTRQILRQLPAGEECRRLTVETFLNHSIFLGLTGESHLARGVLDELIRSDPKDRRARDILEALPE